MEEIQDKKKNLVAAITSPVASTKTSAATEMEAMDLEIKKLELAQKKADLEAKQMEILERRANSQDLQERLAEREMKRETKGQRSKQNGDTLRSTGQQESARQTACTHRKGGNGIQGYVQGKGQKDDHSLMRHHFANGDVWQRCMRCGKTWKPPVKLDFTAKDGTFNEASYMTAQQVYKAALEMSSSTIPSGGTQWRFSDDGEHYRSTTRSTNLR